MNPNDPSRISQIRKIDNSRHWMPVLTFLLVLALIAIFVWFFRGGSYRLYASVFFTLYFLTRQVWVSVILIGVLQNIIFIPLRIIGDRFSASLKDFEDELERVKNENEQYILFNEKIRQGNVAVVFYVFNFVLNAIAFFSAGRIFLIDFYTQKLDPHYLYSFVPYPQYPLLGTDFHFPFFKITETISLHWSTILLIWLGITLLFAIPKFLWRFVRVFLSKNKQVLNARINYNRMLLSTGGFSGTVFILSLIILRHIPVGFEGWMLVADLTRQNSTMNLITAAGTFITTVHAGYKNHSRAAKEAEKAGIPEDVIIKVFKDKMRQSFKNAFILGLGAYFVTSQIPSAFELSVATFEAIYILSPYTFDRFVTKKTPSEGNSPPATT